LGTGSLTLLLLSLHQIGSAHRKLAPTRYGDRLLLVGDPENPIQHLHKSTSLSALSDDQPDALEAFANRMLIEQKPAHGEWVISWHYQMIMKEGSGAYYTRSRASFAPLRVAPSPIGQPQ